MANELKRSLLLKFEVETDDKHEVFGRSFLTIPDTTTGGEKTHTFPDLVHGMDAVARITVGTMMEAVAEYKELTGKGKEGMN